MLDEWAYGAVYPTSDDRRRALEGWLEHYNHRRPHAASAASHPPRD